MAVRWIHHQYEPVTAKKMQTITVTILPKAFSSPLLPMLAAWLVKKTLTATSGRTVQMKPEDVD